MSTIGSNIAALKSLHNLRLNEDGFAKATERLSSGKRLNSAGDDAAGAAGAAGATGAAEARLSPPVTGAIRKSNCFSTPRAHWMPSWVPPRNAL